MTHKKKDCLERPRKVGAKFSGSNFAPDERILPKLSLTFDGKRDRWNGYDNFAHTEVTYEYMNRDRGTGVAGVALATPRFLNLLYRFF